MGTNLSHVGLRGAAMRGGQGEWSERSSAENPGFILNLSMWVTNSNLGKITPPAEQTRASSSGASHMPLEAKVRAVLGSTASIGEPSPRLAMFQGLWFLGAEAAAALVELCLHIVGCDWEVKCGARAGWQARAAPCPLVGPRTWEAEALQGGAAGEAPRSPGWAGDWAHTPMSPRAQAGGWREWCCLTGQCEHLVGPGSSAEGSGPMRVLSKHESLEAQSPRQAGSEGVHLRAALPVPPPRSCSHVLLPIASVLTGPSALHGAQLHPVLQTGKEHLSM